MAMISQMGIFLVCLTTSGQLKVYDEAEIKLIAIGQLWKPLHLMCMCKPAFIIERLPLFSRIVSVDQDAQTGNSKRCSMMKIKILISLALLEVLLFPTNVRAWDNAGHEVVAQIAYDILSKEKPAAKAKLDTIVQADPRPLRKDLLVCAIWPDLNKHRNQIKNAPPELFADAPVESDWHFVDIPYDETNAQEIDDFINMPGKTPNPRHAKSTGNVVIAIRYYSTLLKKAVNDTHASARDRADYLSWLVHYTGDVHQPLHCVNVSDPLENYTPPESGDAGGNGFVINGVGKIPELHAFWDDQIDFQDREKGKKQDAIHPDHAQIEAIAQRLESTYPQSQFGEELGKSDPKDWALESFSYRTNVYALTPDTRPSTQYEAFAKTTAEKRVTLAGYRLAQELESILE